MQVLSTFPGTDVPDIHSVNEVARVDALIRIRATRNVREKFSKTSSTLATFYGELFRVQMTLSDDAPAGSPQDRYALAKITDEFREQVDEIEAAMRGDR